MVSASGLGNGLPLRIIPLRPRNRSSNLSDLGVNLQCDATLLAQGLYGIAIQKGEVGNVFVTAATHKHHRLVWNA